MQQGLRSPDPQGGNAGLASAIDERACTLISL